MTSLFFRNILFLPVQVNSGGAQGEITSEKYIIYQHDFQSNMEMWVFGEVMI